MEILYRMKMLSTWFLPDYAYLVQCPLGRSPTSPSSSKNILGMLALVFSSSSLPWSSTQGSWRLGLIELTKIEMCVCNTSKSQDLLCIILNCIHLVVSHLSSPWKEFYPCMPEKIRSHLLLQNITLFPACGKGIILVHSCHAPMDRRKYSGR